MKKVFFLLAFLMTSFVHGQFMHESHFSSEKDTIHYEKSIEYAEKRTFKEDLRKKYDDKEFQYTEEEEKPEKKEKTSASETAFINGLVFFFSKIFPFLLGIAIVFIILKTFLGTEIGFWNFKKSKSKVAEKLIYEDEDIHETDIDGLLQKAIDNKDYRLAIRYYYLSVLKTLSNKKLIDYHKDKTNSEYLFEIEDTNTRKHFSYLSYVYSYIWYGEFPIDETNFKLAESKYQSFKTSLK